MDHTAANEARNRPSRELPNTDRPTDLLHYVVMHAPENDRDRAFLSVTASRRADRMVQTMHLRRRPS